MKIEIYNTKSRSIEEFKAIDPPGVGMYTCGQTVYDYTHIGHGRKYVMDDILRRTLEYLGYKVKHVQNVTDVGHLVSDEDEGEDKLEKGAKKAGMDVWQTAEFFTKDFYSSMDKLNILRPNIISKATEHIKDQIEMAKKLLERDFAYETPEAVYFDVSKYPQYSDFSGQKLKDKRVAVREDINIGKHKRNPQDFALWFKRVGHFKDHVMFWQSPWGDGFPGWHIECSAMSTRYLGETFDIHTGGVDHIAVHHTNEIAQSFGANGKIPANYWVHSEHLIVDGQKMSKSLGNAYRVLDVEEKGFSPLSLRYFYLGAHYRTKQNFTWEALAGAESAYEKLKDFILALPDNGEVIGVYKDEFEKALLLDLNMPQCLAILWKVTKDPESKDIDKKATILKFDEVLGLGLSELKKEEIPPKIYKLASERENARLNKDFKKADIIRQEIENQGFKIKDTDEGPRITDDR